ncbi:MAG: phosphate ABC transporter substrate-binding protein PstS [Bradyrhizobium sp.]|nr:phosphate ABC transporter substrate-binding protein PstS [Bradyrhizobium sp.]
MPRTVRFAVTAITATFISIGSAQATDITGAGSTFVYPILAKWADAYKKETGNSLNYQSIGSGGGIKQIESRTVTFGASDQPLKVKDLDAHGLAQWPAVMGAIVPVVNLAGVKPGDLVLDGPTLAKIFIGTITKWDDPAIKALNPSLNLPSQSVAVVHRSDGSGTTFNFTDYLSKVLPDWANDVGANTAVEWPVGIGSKGNEGVAATVSKTSGSIGYVEYAYSKQNAMTFARMINRDGKTVTPNASTFQAAAVNADWAHAPGFYQILTNQPGPDSWPITASTFILMQKEAPNAASSSEALKFFAWSYTKGGKLAEDLDYIPMPAAVVALVEKSWAGDIKGDGKILFDGK